MAKLNRLDIAAPVAKSNCLDIVAQAAQSNRLYLQLWSKVKLSSHCSS